MKLLLISSLFYIFISEGIIIDKNPNYESEMESMLSGLHKAVYKGDIQEVNQLLKNGININIKDQFGNAPIHWVKDNLQITKLLITKGADVNAKNNEGDTLLHLVENEKIAKFLIEKGANINAQNNQKQTPLNVIIRNVGVLTILINELSTNRANIINLLILKGADTNIKDSLGNTPLHLLSERDILIAKLLIDNKANINATNNKGQTPFDTIDSEGIKKYIQEKGGKSGQALESKQKAEESKKESLWIKIKNLFKRGG